MIHPGVRVWLPLEDEKRISLDIFLSISIQPYSPSLGFIYTSRHHTIPSGVLGRLMRWVGMLRASSSLLRSQFRPKIVSSTDIILLTTQMLCYHLHVDINFRISSIFSLMRLQPILDWCIALLGKESEVGQHLSFCFPSFTFKNTDLFNLNSIYTSKILLPWWWYISSMSILSVKYWREGSGLGLCLWKIFNLNFWVQNSLESIAVDEIDDATAVATFSINC